jgi:hypothetical protein
LRILWENLEKASPPEIDSVKMDGDTGFVAQLVDPHNVQVSFIGKGKPGARSGVVTIFFKSKDVKNINVDCLGYVVGQGY